MSFTLKPHEYVKTRGRGSAMLRLRPYTRIRVGEEFPPVYIQGGVYYYEDGTEVPAKDLPANVKEAANKLSDEAKKECGLVK